MLSRSELPPESQLVQVQEQVRHHEDRMSYLESRHGSLQRQVSFKVAIDSEFDDWVTNRSDEDWFSISGLPRLGELTRQEWQNAARRQIADYIKLVLQANRSRLDFEVLYVANQRTQARLTTMFRWILFIHHDASEICFPGSSGSIDPYSDLPHSRVSPLGTRSLWSPRSGSPSCVRSASTTRPPTRGHRSRFVALGRGPTCSSYHRSQLPNDLAPSISSQLSGPFLPTSLTTT